MADDKWTWNFNVYDDSDSPTKEGYYKTIDDEGNEITDYYFNEPRLTPHGIGYWKYGTRPIIAWKYLGDTADTPQTDELVEEFKNFDREELILLIECQKERIGELLADKDTPQTDCEACELDGKADVCKICRVSNYEPQTDCGWK